MAAGRTRANLAVAKVGDNGQISVYNSAGAVDVIVDVLGWFEEDVVGPAGSVIRRSDMRVTFWSGLEPPKPVMVSFEPLNGWGPMTGFIDGVIDEPAMRPEGSAGQRVEVVHRPVASDTADQSDQFSAGPQSSTASRATSSGVNGSFT